MLFTTPTQFLVLVLCLVAGWLFGLASSSGGKKWRERYRTLEVENKRLRDDVTAETRTRDARIAELEADRDRWAVSHSTAPGAAGVAAATTHHDAGHRGGGMSGWFGWGRDNLSRIRGIDEGRERLLNDRGIKTFKALEGMTPDDERALEGDLGLTPGTIEREHWREQAAMIREGREDEHVGRFG